jgi:hypothetical protein
MIIGMKSQEAERSGRDAIEANLELDRSVMGGHAYSFSPAEGRPSATLAEADDGPDAAGKIGAGRIEGG